MRMSIGGALVSSILLGVPGTAMAADIPMKVPSVAPVVAPGFSWTGCYVGGYAGGAWARNVNVTEGRAQPGGPFAAGTLYSTPNGAPYSYQLDAGFIGGGTVGCNYQASVFVIGLEGELGYIRLRGSAVDPTASGCSAATPPTRPASAIGTGSPRHGLASRWIAPSCT